MAEASAISEAQRVSENQDVVSEETRNIKTDEKAETSQNTLNKEVEQANNEVTPEFSVDVDPAVVDKLTAGFLAMCLPDLQRSKASVDEILQNQQILKETLEQENSKFSDCKTMAHLADFMVHAKQYYNKLVNIKKDMNSLKEKSAKLKKRAIKLQQQKQKEELQKAQQQEKELERERMLSAKVAKKSSKTGQTVPES